MCVHVCSLARAPCYQKSNLLAAVRCDTNRAPAVDTALSCAAMNGSWGLGRGVCVCVCMRTSPCLSLSVCLSVCLPACLSVCLSVCHSPMGGTGSWIKPQVQTCAPSWRGLCECSLVPADGQCDSAPRPPLHPSQIPRHCSTSCCTNRRFQGTPAPQHGQSFLAALAAHPAPQAHSLAQGCSGGRGS